MVMHPPIMRSLTNRIYGHDTNIYYHPHKYPKKQMSMKMAFPLVFVFIFHKNHNEVLEGLLRV